MHRAFYSELRFILARARASLFDGSLRSRIARRRVRIVGSKLKSKRHGAPKSTASSERGSNLSTGNNARDHFASIYKPSAARTCIIHWNLRREFPRKRVEVLFTAREPPVTRGYLCHVRSDRTRASLRSEFRASCKYRDTSRDVLQRRGKPRLPERSSFLLLLEIQCSFRAVAGQLC